MILCSSRFLSSLGGVFFLSLSGTPPLSDSRTAKSTWEAGWRAPSPPTLSQVAHAFRLVLEPPQNASPLMIGLFSPPRPRVPSFQSTRRRFAAFHFFLSVRTDFLCKQLRTCVLYSFASADVTDCLSFVFFFAMSSASLCPPLIRDRVFASEIDRPVVALFPFRSRTCLPSKQEVRAL